MLALSSLSLLLLASFGAAAPISMDTMISVIEAAVALPNSTQTNVVDYFYRA